MAHEITSQFRICQREMFGGRIRVTLRKPESVSPFRFNLDNITENMSRELDGIRIYIDPGWITWMCSDIVIEGTDARPGGASQASSVRFSMAHGQTDAFVEGRTAKLRALRAPCGMQISKLLGGSWWSIVARF